jgi:hypothetical protein
VEFGIIFFQYVQLRDAAQEGALYGSTQPSDDSAIIDRIKGSSNKPIDLPTKVNDGTPTAVTVQISIEGHASGTSGYYDRACEGNGIKVQVTYTHNIFMPFMPQLIGRNSIPLTATVTDTILAPYNPANPPATSSTCVLGP